MQGRKKKVDTSDVRPDSWIVVIPLTTGEHRSFWKEAQALKKKRKAEIRKELKEIAAQGDNAASKLQVMMLEDEYEDLQSELAMDIGFDVLAGRLVDWSWTDKDGEKLPIPEGDDLSVFDDLEQEEMQAISDAILGNTKVRRKKS
jgi:hypothetical protein